MSNSELGEGTLPLPGANTDSLMENDSKLQIESISPDVSDVSDREKADLPKESNENVSHHDLQKLSQTLKFGDQESVEEAGIENTPEKVDGGEQSKIADEQGNEGSDVCEENTRNDNGPTCNVYVHHAQIPPPPPDDDFDQDPIKLADESSSDDFTDARTGTPDSSSESASPIPENTPAKAIEAPQSLTIPAAGSGLVSIASIDELEDFKTPNAEHHPGEIIGKGKEPISESDLGPEDDSSLTEAADFSLQLEHNNVGNSVVVDGESSVLQENFSRIDDEPSVFDDSESTGDNNLQSDLEDSLNFPPELMNSEKKSCSENSPSKASDSSGPGSSQVESPLSEGLQRRRNSSSAFIDVSNNGDFCPNEQIIDYLVDVSDDAEARLAARRQARAEAREIRMKELEKQQKEHDESADRHYDMYSTGTTGGGSGGGGGDVVNRAAFRVALGSHRGPSHSVGSASYHSSRRSSEDSSEDGMVSIRDMRHELKELEDKFRKSMVHNAQLDNEKSALTYQVELLKDKIEDLEESLTLLQREYRDKCRDFENLKRLSTQLKDELEYCKAQLLEKEELIKEYGLVVVENEVEVDLGNGEKETRIKRSLVSQETAQVLSSLGSGSLDVRLKKFLEEKNDLLDQIRRLTIDLEEERNKHSKGDRGGAPHNTSNSSAYTNGPDEDCIDAQKDASKQLADYRFKTQKYEQEIATLQANVARLDGQVVRFKSAAEEAESREDDLKIEKRKLQRELREAQSKLDELETTNSHLQKRLDKLKTAKSTLLKEL